MAHGPGHLEQQQPAEPSQLISRHAHADAPNTPAPASLRQCPKDRSGTRQPRAAIIGKPPTEHKAALAAPEARDPVFATSATGG
jgi:hypothetical protein